MKLPSQYKSMVTGSNIVEVEHAPNMTYNITL